MSDGVGGESYGYDQLGRMISLTKTIGATNYPLAYSYNLASELAQIIYPSGRAVAQSFDPIGRLTQITSSSVNYLTVPASSGYNSANEVLSATYGNGVRRHFHLQLAPPALHDGLRHRPHPRFTASPTATLPARPTMARFRASQITWTTAALPPIPMTLGRV